MANDFNNDHYIKEFVIVLGIKGCYGEQAGNKTGNWSQAQLFPHHMVSSKVRPMYPISISNSNLSKMYRSEISKPQLENPNLIDRIIVIILPNYFYEYNSVLQHLTKEKFGIVEKTVKHFKSDDVMEWKSADLESQDIWELSDRLSDGPCMLLLCQRANAFIEMKEIAKYHNVIAHRMSSNDGIYYSKTTIAAYHDTLFFFPTYIDEKTMLKHAKDYLSVEVWPKLSQGLARLAVERPDNPIKWLADHLKQL